jgi:V/A-type H+-transporting ATPase subunit D
MALLRTRRSRERLNKAVALLRRKREALVAELFRAAHPAAEARRVILDQARHAYPALWSALARHGSASLEALARPLRDLEVEMTTGSIWGVVVSRISSPPTVMRTVPERGIAPPFTGPAVWQAAREFERLVQLLLESGPREVLIRRLGTAVARVSVQINTLEKRIGPLLEAQIRALRRALAEREREEYLRHKHLLRTRSRSGPRKSSQTGHSSPRQHISQNSHS